MNQELVVPESPPDPHFFQDYNDVQPKKIKYSSTKIKTRNLLINVSYRWYKLKDEKRSFEKDLFCYILLNLNPTELHRKHDSDFERNQLKWYGMFAFLEALQNIYLKKIISQNYQSSRYY